MTPEQQKLVVENDGLVWYVVRQMVRCSPQDLEDWHSIGIFGLITAAKKYDAGLGTKFSTYAVPWIHSFVARELRRRRSVGRKSEPPLSLDAILQTGGRGANVERSTLAEVIADERVDVEGEVVGRLMAAQTLQFLSNTELRVLRERMEGKTQWGISRDVGCSQAQVSRVLNRVRRKAREQWYSLDLGI